MTLAKPGTSERKEGLIAPPHTPYPLRRGDTPFDAANQTSQNPAGWIGIGSDPDAPTGGNGPGFSAPYPSYRPLSFAEEQQRALVHAQLLTGASITVSSPSLLDSLEHAAALLGKAILGDIAFNLGVAVGLAESVFDQLKGISQLARTFVLAAQYEIKLAASQHHCPDWAVNGMIAGVEAGSGLAAFAIGATPADEEEAYNTVQGLVNEVKSLMGGDGKAWAQLKKLGAKKWQEAQDDWNQYVSLMSSGDPGKEYNAGVLFGRFIGELLTTILLLITIVGTALRVARAAAAGARILAELAGLIVEAEGTEIGTAAKALAQANTELEAARAAGNAQRLAEAERKVAAAAKDLQQKAEAAQQVLQQNAPKLVEESGKLKQAKANAQRPGGGDTSGSGAGDDTAPLERSKPAKQNPESAPRKPAKLADGFAENARSAEVRTAQRLAQNPEFDGRTFKAPPPPDPGYDWTDDMGRTYDAMGDGTKSRFFNLDQFTKSIDSHLLKSNDFTVIDMTGYTPEQAAAVSNYVDGLSAAKQAMIRRLGF